MAALMRWWRRNEKSARSGHSPFRASLFCCPASNRLVVCFSHRLTRFHTVRLSDCTIFQALIQLKDVHKSFGPKNVLDGFTLDVPEGETMVIIGYSGTGKSVAIKHIVGLLEPDSGEVWVDGLNVPELHRRELYALRSRIGYVFQFAALFDSFTIGENVAMGLRKQGELDESAIVARVDEALDLVDLPGVRDHYPAELSGGMRKRVGNARALALRPKYILYDEPTTGHEPVTSAVIDQLMVRMREKLKVTSIVITHDMRSAYSVGTRIAMLYEGRVRWVGTVPEIQKTTDPIVRQFVEGRPDLEEQGGPGEPATSA